MPAIDMEVVSNSTTVQMEVYSMPPHNHDGRYYTEDEISSIISSLNVSIGSKLNASQGASNAGKAMVVGATGSVEYVVQFDEVESVTRWNVMRKNQTETPNLTLPEPETGTPQEIVYVFTALTTGALFTAPSGYTLFDEGKTMSEATSAIQYTDLTVGSMYECDFLVVGPNKISLLKVEHAGV